VKDAPDHQQKKMPISKRVQSDDSTHDQSLDSATQVESDEANAVAPDNVTTEPKATSVSPFRKWLTRLIALFVAVPLILYFGFLLAIQLIDFNGYKTYLESEAKNRTGLELKLEGNIDVSVMPFSVSMQDVKILNPEGFQTEKSPYLLHLESLQLEVSIWDIFVNHRVSILGLETVKAKLHLIRAKSGAENWKGGQKLAQWIQPNLQSQPTSLGFPTAQAAFPATQNLNWFLNSLVVREASIQFDDEKNKNHFFLSKIDLMAFDVQPERPFKLLGEAHFSHQERGLQWFANGRTSMQMARDFSSLSFANWSGFLKFKLSKQADIPALRVESVGKWFYVDVDKQAFDIKGVMLSSLDSKLSVDLKGHWFNPQDHKLAGKVTTQKLNLQNWLRHIAVPLPDFVNQMALTSLDSQFSLQKDQHGFDVENLTLQLDQATLSGQVSQRIQSKQPPLYQFDLAIDNLNLDAYEVKVIEEGQKVAEGESSLEKDEKTYLPIGLPVNHLRELNMVGHLSVRNFQAWQMRFEALDFNLTAESGQLEFAPLDAQLNGGHLISKLKLDVSGDTPRYDWKGRVKQIALAGLLGDGWQYDQLTGQYDGHFHLKTKGVNSDRFKQNLNGRFQAKLSKGLVKGVQLEKLFLGQAMQPEDQMPYDLVFMEGKIQQGEYRLKTLNVQAPQFTALGAGSMNLAEATSDIHFHTRYKNPPAALSSIKGLEVPVHMSGALAQPTWSVDIDKMLRKPENREKLLDQIGNVLKTLPLDPSQK